MHPNLTRNVLIAMFLGALIGAILYYSSFFQMVLRFFFEYIFKLGGEIFINLLKLVVVPLVFFSLVSGIASLSSLKSFGNIASKTIALYLLTTAIAVSVSLVVGSIFQPGSGYLMAETVALKDLPEGRGIYQAIVNIVPLPNIIDAMAKNEYLAIVFLAFFLKHSFK